MLTKNQQAYDQLSSLIVKGTPQAKWPDNIKKLWMSATFIDQLEFYEVLDTYNEDTPRILSALTQYYFENGNYHQAEKTCKKLHKLQPRRVSGYLYLATCSLLKNNTQQFTKILKKFLIRKARKRIPILALAKLILSSPDSSFVHKTLLQLIRDLNISYTSDEKIFLQKACKYLVQLNRPEKDYKRPLITYDLDKEINYSADTKSGHTVVLFLEKPHAFDFIPIETIDRYLASQNCNLITCYDHHRLSGMNGFQQHGNNFEDSLQYLNSLCEKYNTQKLTLLCYSLGSYGVVNYGLNMQANNIVCFSGMSDISYKNLKNKKISYPKIVERMNKNFSEEQLDLRKTIKKHGVNSQIHWIYGENCYIDSYQSKKIINLKNVRPISVKAARKHNSTYHCSLDGTLLKFLNL
jgi:tetratricopeptide (TPR) repeat protein